MTSVENALNQYWRDLKNERNIMDETEGPRRFMTAMVNSGAMDEVIEKEQQWTTDQLREEFDVIGFLAPYVEVRRKADGVTGVMMFKHNPRIYFEFKPEDPHVT